jgi:hypothetical protein
VHRFRSGIQARGFTIKAGETPIVPIMLHDAKLAQDFARGMLVEGVYVIGFFFPVVPKGEARIRVQISAAHDGAGSTVPRRVRESRPAAGCVEVSSCRLDFRPVVRIILNPHGE